MPSLSRLFVFGILGVVLSACETPSLQDDFIPGWDPDDPQQQASGQNPWQNAEQLANPSCETQDDCLDGEICLNDVCQIQRCSNNVHASNPPLGRRFRFFADHEFVVMGRNDQQTSMDVFVPTESTVDYLESWLLNDAAAETLDTAAGSFLDKGTPGYAVLKQSSEDADSTLDVYQGNTATGFAIGMTAAAIDAGDVDGDGMDEIIAVANDGAVSLCHIDENRCDGWTLLDSVDTPNSWQPVDVAMGDIDADGYEEALVIYEQSMVTEEGLPAGTSAHVFIWHLDNQVDEEGAFTGGDVVTVPFIGEAERMTAGDLNVDGEAEVYVLGLFDSNGSEPDRRRRLVRYQWAAGTLSVVDFVNAPNDWVDIEAGATDPSESGRVVGLSSSGFLDFYVVDEESDSLTADSWVQLHGTSHPERLAMMDIDGDSPTGTLVSAPIQVPGKMIPTVLLQVPPYDRFYSAGTSSVSVGNGNSAGSSSNEGVSLGLSVGFGANFDLLGIVGNGLSLGFSNGLSSGMGRSEGINIGGGFGYSANPTQFGLTQAAVVVAGGCYQSYEYEIQDPKSKMGGDGGRLAFLVPVEGKSLLLDLRRYNAMAEAIGDMPIIESNEFRSGELDSYPTVPLRADGSIVSVEDMLVPNPQSKTVSGAGGVNWSIFISSGESQSVGTSSGVSLGTSAGTWGYNFSAGISLGVSSGNSISVGENTSFGGAVPPIIDNPSTPEYEPALFNYTFTPYVYHQRYTNADDEEASYYVITYTVD